MLFLIRHGQTDWNARHIIQGKSDIALNENGREQARERAVAFKGAEIEAIYSSPLKRAYETAEIIAEITGCEAVYKDDRLRERYFGSLDGQYSEGRPFKYYYGDLPDGEHQDHVYQRLMSALLDISKRHEGNVIVVAHGAISGTYVSHQTDEEFRLVNTACIAIDPETLSMVGYNLSNDEIRRLTVE